MACQPGYQPTYAAAGATELTFVSSCKAISNCDSSVSMLANRCESCLVQTIDNQLTYFAFSDESQ